MNRQETIIRHHATGAILMRGAYASVAAAVEDAITGNVSLDGADLRGANLAHAMLDGIRLRYANLRGANLTGANVSEVTLESCDLRDVTLYGACLCESVLSGCDFSGAQCGGTDIAGGWLRNGLFSTLSAMQMNFRDCALIADCALRDERSGQIALFSAPPVYVQGLEQPVIITESHVRIGAHTIPRSLWSAIANDNGPAWIAGNRPDHSIFHFVRRHAALLDSMTGKRV